MIHTKIVYRHAIIEDTRALEEFTFGINRVTDKESLCLIRKSTNE